MPVNVTCEGVGASAATVSSSLSGAGAAFAAASSFFLQAAKLETTHSPRTNRFMVPARTHGLCHLMQTDRFVPPQPVRPCATSRRCTAFRQLSLLRVGSDRVLELDHRDS